MRASILAFVVVAATASTAAAQTAPATLDYDFFKANVQPIFLAKRPGHARCISCHGQGTTLRLQPLAAGATTWTRGREPEELRGDQQGGAARQREEQAPGPSAGGKRGR